MPDERKQVRAAAIGVDQIVKVWESMNDGYPYFAVYYNRNNKYFQYNRDDIEAAKDFLITNLSVLEDSGDNSLYYLNIYSEPKPNYPNKDMIGSFPFRLNAYNEVGAVGSYGGNVDGLAKMINDAHLKQIELVKEIEALKNENQPLDWFDRIGGLLESPGTAQVIVPLLQPVLTGIMGLVGKIAGLPMNQQPLNNNIMTGIAGTPETDTDQNQLIDAALDRLEKHGNLAEMLTVLANFADSNPGMFKVYFEGLKSQQ